MLIFPISKIFTNCLYEVFKWVRKSRYNTYFIFTLQALLEENPAKHPIIILKDVPFQHLTAILEFMYAGEVNVAQDQLPAFLKTAERLKVKGLAEAPQNIKQE